MALAVEHRNITQLKEVVDGLPGHEREVFDCVMSVGAYVGQLKSDTFSLDGLRSQTILKIYNKPERIEAKINAARALRPQTPVDGSKLRVEIAEQLGKDDFCLGRTPINTFGRIRGTSCTTAGNLFLGSKWHAVVPFDEHDPLIPPTREQFLDRLDVPDQWFEAANRADDRAIYSSLIQNNLDRAGASIWSHGHLQLQQELDCHEGVMEGLLDVLHTYRWRTGRDYFQDLFRAHLTVGLGVERNGVMVIPYLTPLKERHIRMLAYSFDESQRDVLFRIFRYFMAEDGFGAKAFNFSIGYRPIAYDGRDWGGFPAIIADIVDRGDINKRNGDIRASELNLRSTIVATDPYRVHDGIVEALAA